MSGIKVHQMKKRAGVFVASSQSGRDAFDELLYKLYDFYEAREKVFVPERVREDGKVVSTAKFNPTKTRYAHEVYDQDFLVTQEGYVDEDGEYHGLEIDVTQHGYVNMVFYGSERGKRFVKGWDFPHLPEEWSRSKFGIFFDLKDKNMDKRKAEAQAFADYMKRI